MERQMKFTIWIALVTIVALAGCDNTDESAKLKAELDQVYSKSAGASKTKIAIVGDIKNGELLAKQCAKCHGMNGVDVSSGAPFIAGLEQNYFISSMLSYKAGKRKNSDMKAAASKLKPEDLGDISAYYASLKTPWKGEHVGMGKKSLVSLDPATRAAGEVLAERCNSCHGPNGFTKKDSIIPSLAAMSPEYFTYSLKTYFNDKRDHGVMKVFKNTLDDNDQKIRQLATYYALQATQTPPLPKKGNAKAGEHAAATECAGCHGMDGNSLNPEIPQLAGQPAEYLIYAMRLYRDGGRNDQLMSPALRGMSDNKITDIAAYYAQQKQESPLGRQQGDQKTFDPVAQGEKIAPYCDGCHGHKGNSTKPGVPSLTGLGIRYFVTAASAYRDGLRKHPGMEKVVSRLSDSDIEKAGFYYGLQTPVNNKKPKNVNQATVEKIAKECVSCHGKNGVSTDSKTPSLAGQDAAYLEAALRAYAKDVRVNDAMKSPAEALKPQEVLDIAKYFASLPVTKPDNAIPVQPSVSIAVKCNRCHGENGNSTESGTPSLAGQSEAYLALALKQYQDGRRKNKYMAAMADVLSVVEIKAIAAFYAKQERKK